MLNLSMPDFTPAITISAQSRRKMLWKRSGSRGELMKEENSEDRMAASLCRKDPHNERNRYSIDHPPTTL